MKTGLLGKTLPHSFSPQIHHLLGDEGYSLYEVAEADLTAFLATTPADGLNVTLPYKEAVIPYLKSLSPVAERIGAVNTLRRDTAGAWHGDNTDYLGMIAMLEGAAMDVRGKKCLILGGGGTAKTATVVLEDLGAERITLIERRGTHTYADLPRFRDAQLLINTTPVGMSPDCPRRLVDLDDLPAIEGVCDVVYNPLRTALILDAQARGIPCAVGLMMLCAQAVAAHRRFFPAPHPHPDAATIHRRLRSEMENIVLIGMPGVGKSSVAASLGEIMGRPVLDLDEIFASRLGNPGDFIERRGEAAFREEEHRLVLEAGRCHGHIIACGGGVITRRANDAPLRQNGRIYHLTRPLDALATEGRPLSRNLEELAAARMPRYRELADVTLENTTPIATAAAIKEDFYAHPGLKRPQHQLTRHP